jgi:hypothetical protein
MFVFNKRGRLAEAASYDDDEPGSSGSDPTF